MQEVVLIAVKDGQRTNPAITIK